MKLRVLIAFLATGAACAAFGGVVTNDYSWVRGTHYRLNGDAAKTARELGMNAWNSWAIRFSVSPLRNICTVGSLLSQREK